MDTATADIQRIVDRYLQSEVSVSMALMELVQFTEDVDSLAHLLPMLAGDPGKLRVLRQNFAENEAGCRTIVRMIRQRLDSPEIAQSAEEGIARSRTLFDSSVAQSEESSVALYSLGNPGLLAAATDEVVDLLEDWGVLGSHRDALEIGRGIGRLMVPLSSRVRSVVGTDVSSGMITAAARRLEGCRNASVHVTAGQDLAEFDAASMDLVYSVDAFPYLVLAGHALVERHFARSVEFSGPMATSPSSTTSTGGVAMTPIGRYSRLRRVWDWRSSAPMNHRFGFGTASACS